MTNPSKRKGDGFEREVVAILQSHGIAAEKIPLSGAVGGSFTGDILCPVLGTDQRLECKRRARAFQTLYSMLGDSFALVVRDDHTKPLVVMTIDRWAALTKGRVE